MSDWLIYFLLKGGMGLMPLLPLSFWLSAGRALGGLYYFFAGKKNRRAYAHLKLAFPHMTPAARKRVIKKMYQCFAQNAVEALFLPFIDRRYIEKYVTMSGADVVRRELERGRGIIFLGCHAGSWELSNVACAMTFAQDASGGAPGGGAALSGRRYAMLAQPQSRNPRLDAFLNSLREKKGCHVIRVNELKVLMQHLGGANMLGAVADHGGRDGTAVTFFGKTAMTPVGSLKLARKLGIAIVLVFARRMKGPRHELFFRLFEPKWDGEPPEQDMKANLEAVNRVFEDWITQYPQEYLWTYKRWKYSPQKNVLILSDGKAGHLKQSQALVRMISATGLDVQTEVVEVRHRSRARRNILALAALFFGGRLARLLLPLSLAPDVFRDVTAGFCDIVVSTGSSLTSVNLAVSSENQAKSFVVMKPGILPVSRFDLVVMPRHDEPKASENVAACVGSLCALTPETMKADFLKLAAQFPALFSLEEEKKPTIGLLIGGDSRHYAFSPEVVSFVCEALEKVLAQQDARLLLTTSRRTPAAALEVFKARFRNAKCCPLFVDASGDNPEGAVGGILHASDVVLVSGESISMVSEAVASGRRVVVFEPHPKTGARKIRRFLSALSEGGHIDWVKPNEIYDKLSQVLRARPPVEAPDIHAGLRNRLKELLAS